MYKIPLQLAQAGMILAKPATRENGMVLVAAGTALTDALISRLESMGVEQVVLEGEAQDMGGSGAEALARKEERLEQLFRNFKDDRYMQRVKGIVRDYYAHKCLQAAAQAARSEGQ
jgi:hypothetical protein